MDQLLIRRTSRRLLCPVHFGGLRYLHRQTELRAPAFIVNNARPTNKDIACNRAFSAQSRYSENHAVVAEVWLHGSFMYLRNCVIAVAPSYRENNSEYNNSILLKKCS